MAAPDPAADPAFRCEVGQVNRLRIMNKNDVRFQIESLRVLLVDLVVQVEVGVPKEDGQSLETVMKGFGDAIKIGVAFDHFPAGA